jgi:tRNA(fMet)-specific endonuclease VapC
VYLVDTNVCIAALNGKDRHVAKLFRLHANHIVLCSVVKAELLFGAQNSAKIAANVRSIESLFDLFTSLPFDDDAAKHYALIRAVLRNAGTPIGPNDMLIAAIALANGASVVTRNVVEFSRVPNLSVETW